MTAVVNSPAEVSTVVKRRFIAVALHVIQPDLSRSTAVRVTKIHTGSPAICY